MKQDHKRAELREKELRLAIFRIERGRSKTKATKLSIASVAREAGVSTALIHNHYPAVAEAIRVSQGRDSRIQRDEKHEQLKALRQENKDLRNDIELLKSDVDKLASINEVLLNENKELTAALKDPKVYLLKKI